MEGIVRITGQYWPGVIVDIGIGLMIAPALVKLQWLTLDHKVWAFGLGIILFDLGNDLSRHIHRREQAGLTSPASSLDELP